MFPPPLRAHFVLLIVYVANISAAPPLNVPPESSFATTSTLSPTFSGGLVDYDSALSHAANLDDPGAFTVLAPGESIGSVAFDLPTTDGFTQSRTGDGSITPSNPSTYDTPGDSHTAVEGVADVKLSGNPIVSRHVHDKRREWRMNPSGRGILTVTSCRETYEDRIIADIRLTQELLAGSILEFGTRENPRVPAAFAEWFGQYSLSRSATVQHNLGRIGRRLYLSGVSIMCGGCAEQLGYPVEFSTGHILKEIRICRGFWNISQRSRVRLFISFAGHLVPLDKFTTGRAAAHLHVQTAPLEVLTNIDNYVGYISARRPAGNTNIEDLDPVPPYEPPPPPYEPQHPPPYSGWR